MAEQLIVPKVEILEELEITYEPDNDTKDFIVPKVELSSTSLDTADSDQQAVNLCTTIKKEIVNNYTPVKTENIILSKEVAELQNALKSPEEQDVSAGRLWTDIKREPSPAEVSLPADGAQTLAARLLMNRTWSEDNRVYHNSVTDNITHPNTYTLIKSEQCIQDETEIIEEQSRNTLVQSDVVNVNQNSVHNTVHNGERARPSTSAMSDYGYDRTLTIARDANNLFVCDVCQATRRKKSTFIVHLRTHTGERPFSCELCQKRFSRKHHLTGHMRTHTGKKPYACKSCNKQFTLRSHLTSHMRTHTGEKRFTCNLCLAKFREKHHLHGHMRIHIGGKPFACDLCESRFAHQCSLVRHMRTHTQSV